MTEPSSRRGRALMIGLAVLLLLGGGVLGGKVAVEKVVHDYILAHPEILPQAMENLQRREVVKRLAPIRDDVEKMFPGAVLGNPDGKVTLVEFTDFACGFCRQSVGDVDRLIQAHPNLRVVIRELPILSPQSEAAARMALAAAEQGKYPAFHRLLFAAGQPDPASIEAAATAAGLDLAKAREAAQSDRVESELVRNMELARTLGFNGTPSWIVGDEVLSGAVGIDRLTEAITAAAQAK